MNEHCIGELILLIVISFLSIVGFTISTLLLYRENIKNKIFTVSEIIGLLSLILVFSPFAILFGAFHINELIEEDWINLKKFLYYLALSSPIIMLTTLWVLT